MNPGRFLFLGNQELNGILRGRSVPAARADEAMARGLPWVPANITIGALNTLPPDNPFGPMGEIRFIPDPAARLALPGTDSRPPFDLALCDCRTMEGAAWGPCPRTALKAAVADLAAAGLTMRVAFEHEFTVHGMTEPTHVAFSLSAGRAGAALADRVLATLATAGFTLDQFVAEYGPGQYEIAGQPADPLAAADRTVMTLEAIRSAARDLGLRASFLPKPAMDQVGNGVHMHFSLWRDGVNVTAGPDWLSAVSGPFVAGLLDHAESLVTLTVVSANSYARFRPQSWVGSYICAGLRNREAMVRLVPRARAADGSYPGASLEFRATDGTANVYVAIAAVIRAGLAGLAAGLPAPASIGQDPATLPDAERATLRHLPQAMAEALTAKARADAARWLGEPLAEAWFCCRRNDARHAAEMDFDSLARRLGVVY